VFSSVEGWLDTPISRATLRRPGMEAFMRLSLFGLVLALSAVPVHAKQESFWIEKVAVIAVGKGICGIPLNEGAMQTSIGSAMIELAVNKKTVIDRARKRAHRITADLERQKSRNTFCQGFTYYLQKGYPR
jgi:hypothetical protein